MIRSHRPAVAAITGAIALVGALTLLFLQVEVSASGSASTRTCGSAFDAAVDRSGWQEWWAQDLDDPDGSNQQALVRTDQCPSAVNSRMLIAGLLGASGLVALGLSPPSRPTDRSAGSEDGSGMRASSSHLRTIGGATAATGGLLTLGGLIAVVVLVADADSTLFLYTDRLVVALAGVVVLVPAIALTIGGLVLRAISELLEARRA